MASVDAELKTIRQQVERLQAEAVGLKQLSSTTVWEEQNNCYVKNKRDQREHLEDLTHRKPCSFPLL